jgi:hypothetical protein
LNLNRRPKETQGLPGRTSGFSIWGAHWLGHGSLRGALRHVMAERWGHVGLDAVNEPMVAQAATPVCRLGLAALAGLLARNPEQPGTGLFCGMGRGQRREDLNGQPDHPTGLMDCSTSCRAARSYGLAGPWLLPVSGVPGGLKLLVHAQRSLAKGMPQVICLAAGDSARLTGGDGEPGGAAALGLQKGQGQGAASLGRVELGTYNGPMDSGALADFLEEVGRRAKERGIGPVAAVVMNQPRDLKLQACLDAAARRIAPRARRYALPVDSAGQAGGLMLVMAATALATPRPESLRLVLAAGGDGRVAALVAGAA